MPMQEKPITVVPALTDEQIKDISAFIYERSGIVLGKSKRYLIESRLKTVARITGMRSVGRLVDELSRHRQPQLETLILDALTTNETSWFRDTKPFDALENVVLPHLQRVKSNKFLNIWSAACSSGQEPYSIAIKILESGLFRNWHIRIVATDVARQVLHQAERGVYTRQEMSRGMPAEILGKYFVQIGDVHRIRSEVARLVVFKTHKLQDPPQGLGRFDLIFCRNVLIYFDHKTKRHILHQLSAVMHDHGLLALGGPETTLNLSDDFEPVRLADAIFYARSNAGHAWPTAKKISDTRTHHVR